MSAEKHTNDINDPITASVIRHRLTGIVEEMGEAMLHTSFSQILNSSRDFSTAICGADGHLVAQAEHIPVHVGALPTAVESVAQTFAGEVQPAMFSYLTTHWAFALARPRLCADLSRWNLTFWTVNRAHQSDIGATHGAYNAAATEIWQKAYAFHPFVCTTKASSY